jgi:hypothetical protein
MIHGVLAFAEALDPVHFVGARLYREPRAVCGREFRPLAFQNFPVPLQFSRCH